MKDAQLIDDYCETRNHKLLNDLSIDAKKIVIRSCKSCLKDKSCSRPDIARDMLGTLINTKLFDDSTVLQFYSKSADKPLPGKGAGERNTNTADFSELAKIKGWRKILSNFYLAPFKLDGRTWNTVEHYYHANKFRSGNPEFYNLFTVESNSDISKDPAFAKSAGGKTGISKKYGYKRPKNVNIDSDFFSSGRNKIVMENAQRAKYTQNKLPRKVLWNTKNAMIKHFVRGRDPLISYDLMKIRAEL